MTTTFDYAKAYLQLGWSVIPTRNGDKRPAVPWTAYQEQYASEQDVADWFAGGGYGVGIVTGGISGLVVLDIDGDAGRSSIMGLGIPPTPMVETPRGRHVYFAHPGRPVSNAVGLRPGLDVRADGGYVVAPPSKGYSWILSPSDVELAQMPEWLVAQLAQASRPKPTEEWRRMTASQVEEGQRNEAVAKLAGYLIGKRLDPEVVYNLLGAFNEVRVKPPLHDSEVRKVIRSIVDREGRRRAA